MTQSTEEACLLMGLMFTPLILVVETPRVWHESTLEHVKKIGSVGQDEALLPGPGSLPQQNPRDRWRQSKPTPAPF